MAFVKQKNPTKEQINEYKMTEKEIYEKLGFMKLILIFMRIIKKK